MRADLNSHTLRILVAEDDPINVKLIELVLQGLGYRADVVGSGIDILASLRRERYDVVLMNIRMPRIIALTASLLPEDRAAGDSMHRLSAMRVCNR